MSVMNTFVSKNEMVKDQIFTLNKKIRNLIPKQINSQDYEKAGFSGVREAYLHNKKVERVIIILRGYGCKWALEDEGGCTMCGHLCGSSIGQDIPSQMIQQQFDTEFARYDFSNYPVLCVYNGGSFLNEEEIPKEIRADIFRKINATPEIENLIIESRPEYITDNILDEIEELLPNVKVEIGVGIESSNELIRNHILNKGTTREDYIEIGRKMKDRNIDLLAYILVKPPFLTEKEGIEDTIETCKFAFEIGADTVSLEPTTIQDLTLVSFLYDAGAYRTPWAWSVFEVVKQVHELGNVRIGGFEFFPTPNEFTFNCSLCKEDMIHAIQQYNSTHDLEVIKNFTCKNNCQMEWLEELNRQPEFSDYLDRAQYFLECVDQESVLKKMLENYLRKTGKP